jgi:hypothetical protein
VTALWDGVDALIDRAPAIADLRTHRLHLLAARRWRLLGLPVPADLAQEELEAAFVALAAPAVLREVRSACDGPVIVMKGPEIAACYPDPALRPFADLDLLVPDAHAVQRALIAAGFRPIGDAGLYQEIHHLRPLHSPSLPLYVEVHSRPKWLDGRRPPSFEELVADARPTSLDVDGVLGLAPSHHALLIAAHWWAHEPFSRLGGLLDVAAVVEGRDPIEVASLSRAWGVAKLWRSTTCLADALFFDEGSPWALRLWARNLREVREQAVFESHLRRAIGGFWALPVHEALRCSGASLLRTMTPGPGESWRAKLQRARGALWRASTRRSEHEESLAEPTSATRSR